MESYPHRMFVRMSADGLAQAKALAASLDMSLSELVRLLLQSARPGTSMEPGALVVVDCESAAHLRREMRRWGYHYNQAVHALNAIAYYLRLDEADSADALEELVKVSRKIDAMNEGVVLLRGEMDRITERPVAHI